MSEKIQHCKLRSFINSNQAAFNFSLQSRCMVRINVEMTQTCQVQVEIIIHVLPEI